MTESCASRGANIAGGLRVGLQRRRRQSAQAVSVRRDGNTVVQLDVGSSF